MPEAVITAEDLFKRYLVAHDSGSGLPAPCCATNWQKNAGGLGVSNGPTLYSSPVGGVLSLT